MSTIALTGSHTNEFYHNGKTLLGERVRARGAGLESIGRGECGSSRFRAEVGEGRLPLMYARE